MSPPLLQTVVFADLEASVWGVAWGSPAGSGGFGELRTGSATAGREISFEAAGFDAEWRLAGALGELTISPVSDCVSSARADGFDQLCEVKGSLLVAGAPPIRGIGIRAVRAEIDPTKVQSLRDACVWFGPDDGLVLNAVRPAGARGHDRDLLIGSVFEPDRVTSVADPRLSTTYAADGAPVRAGLELWLEADDDAGEYPRRATGQTIGAQITLAADGFELRAHAMRWQSRGREGIGAYTLAHPR